MQEISSQVVKIHSHYNVLILDLFWLLYPQAKEGIQVLFDACQK